MIDPTSFNRERQIIALDRLRVLSIAYYISGAIGAVFVSFLLIHFFVLLGFSFVPASQWNAPAQTPSSAQHASASPSLMASPTSNSAQAPPVIIFRIIAGVIGLIIICGWTLGALTAYAGHCIKKRKHRLFIYIMAGVNCIWIPYGTVLGIATILLFQWPEVQAEFKT
ncbi:MAG: hypothetical protein DMF27_14785 [Verrucomicrobia bacterium]|nr:MAG: hypothetical protein DMF27_14785 [Verrucomicrobiota bacterium]